MGYVFGRSSTALLQHVHPDLQAVMRAAIRISTVDFRITDGLRSVERQRQLLAAGRSRTMRSRHLTGHAVDVVALPGGKVSWDWHHYEAINAAVQDAATMLSVPIVWGGSWPNFRDGPHLELCSKHHPAED